MCRMTLRCMGVGEWSCHMWGGRCIHVYLCTCKMVKLLEAVQDTQVLCVCVWLSLFLSRFKFFFCSMYAHMHVFIYVCTYVYITYVYLRVYTWTYETPHTYTYVYGRLCCGIRYPRRKRRTTTGSVGPPGVTQIWLSVFLCVFYRYHMSCIRRMFAH